MKLIDIPANVATHVASEGSEPSSLSDDIRSIAVDQSEYGIPLTAVGQEYGNISDDLRGKVAVFKDGTILVSRDHKRSSEVNGFIVGINKRFQREHHRSTKVIEVDLTDLQAAYSNRNAKKVAVADMQKYAMKMFKAAADRNASDIHIRVEPTKTQIFFGIYDEMIHINNEPVTFGEELQQAIYQAMADVQDATFEPTRRQDARIGDKSKMPEGLDAIRIATMPGIKSTAMTLRLLYDASGESTDLANLGFDPEHVETFQEAADMPEGLHIITGPTGSGKSTTLSRRLSGIMEETDDKLNLITIEDPPEYKIRSAWQMPVANAKTPDERALAVYEAIIASLRMAPRILMLGEMRDLAVAQEAFRASMTGHQVWTTLHTSDAFQTCARLKDMGVSEDLIYDPSIVRSISAQRLVKVLCPTCKRPLSDHLHEFPPKRLERIIATVSTDNVFVRNQKGCAACKFTGLSNKRTVIAETVLTNPRLMDIMRHKGRFAGMAYWKNEMGGKTMREHGIKKIQAGIVDPFDVWKKVGPIDIDTCAAGNWSES